MFAALLFFLSHQSAEGDTIYAANTADNTIVAQTLPAAFGTNTLLSFPAALAFDRAGNLYVANTISGTIVKFDTNGVGSLFASSSLARISSLAFDKADNLYVASEDDNRIWKFATNGVGSVFATNSFVLTNKTGYVYTGASHLAFDRAGNLYCATDPQSGYPDFSWGAYTNYLIVKFTTNGSVSVFATNAGTSFWGSQLAIDSAGNAYTDFHDVSGSSIVKFSTNGIRSVFVTNVITPAGMAFDSADNLYVAQPVFVATNQYRGNRYQIEKFAPSGIRSLYADAGAQSRAELENLVHSENLAGGISQPSGVNTAIAVQEFGLAFDPAHRLYAIRNDGMIGSFSTNGVFLPFVSPTFFGPYGMAFDQEGNLFVANYYGNTVAKVAPDGVSSVFATDSGDDSLLNHPIATAVDSVGNIYVANFSGNSITKFTTNGVGSLFATNGLSLPSSLAFDRDDNLFVANRGANNIMKFTPDGVGSLFANTRGSPTGLVFDRSGKLYVANYTTLLDPKNTSIEVFTTNGVGSIFTTNNLEGPFALAFDRAGSLYAANFNSGTIIKLQTNGFSSAVAFFDSITGLAFDRADNLYVADLDVNSFGASGNSVIRMSLPRIFASTGLNQPTGLALDRMGNLYAANSGNNSIVRFATNGVLSAFANSGLDSPYGLVFDRAGNLYAANSGDNSIARFDTNGVASVFATNGLKQPYGLAFDRSGNLYAANHGSSTIERFTANSVASVFADTGANGSAGLAFNTAGNLLVANSDDSVVRTFSTNGVLITYGSSAGGMALSQSPFGEALDSSGNVYVARYMNGTIEALSGGAFAGALNDTLSAGATFIAIWPGSSLVNP